MLTWGVFTTSTTIQYNNKKTHYSMGEKIDKRMQDALKQNIAAIQSRHRIYKNSPKTA